MFCETMFGDIIVFAIIFIVGVAIGYSLCKNNSTKAEKLYQEIKEKYESAKSELSTSADKIKNRNGDAKNGKK